MLCHMKTLTVLLPDPVSEFVFREAARQKVDAAALCSSVIAEHFLSAQTMITAGPVEVQAATPQNPRPAEPTAMFDVQKNFPGYPPVSVRLAQQFVDGALKMPGTTAFKAYSERGVGMRPNFVFVEYLQKSYPGGVGVSFYGRPEDHLRPTLLRPGRNPNYSRSIACTQETLKPLLEEIRRSYELKFGRVR